MAAMLNFMCSELDDEVRKSEIFLTFPSYATIGERQVLLDACVIANIKPRLCSESKAILYAYGHKYWDELQNSSEKKIVVFIDIGYSKTTVTVAKFENNESEIFIEESDRNLGGRDFDWQLLDWLSQKFQE